MIEYKNNITYVDGIGSFHRPVIFITDAKLDESQWVIPEIHERCSKCNTCLKFCPTGAISKDHFLLSAEKCLTYHNERTHPFPNWLKAEWHHCLVGCMICQNICPLNKSYVDNIEEVATFSEQETLQLLSNTPKTKLSYGTIDKLKKINLFTDYELIGRNLTVFLNRNN